MLNAQGESVGDALSSREQGQSNRCLLIETRIGKLKEAVCRNSPWLKRYELYSLKFIVLSSLRYSADSSAISFGKFGWRLDGLSGIK